MSKPQRFVDKCFKDKDGQVVLTQSPNVSIIAFVFFSFIGIVFHNGILGYLTKVLAFGSIFVWSWLELLKGVNYFRRALGLVAIILAVLSAVEYINYIKPV
jgi:hypothetical protein